MCSIGITMEGQPPFLIIQGETLPALWFERSCAKLTARPSDSVNSLIVSKSDFCYRSTTLPYQHLAFLATLARRLFTRQTRLTK